MSPSSIQQRRERVKSIVSELNRIQKEDKEYLRLNFDVAEALSMFVEYRSLRDIGRYFNVAHMTVAYRLRTTYGRYVTNDKVNSCYRSLVRDYLPYKNHIDGQKRQMFQDVKTWAISEMVEHSRSFTENNITVKYVKEAVKNVSVYRSRLTEYHYTKFDVFGDERNDDKRSSLLERIPSKKQEQEEWLRLYLFQQVFNSTSLLLKEVLICLENQRHQKLVA